MPPTEGKVVVDSAGREVSWPELMFNESEARRQAIGALSDEVLAYLEKYPDGEDGSIKVAIWATAPTAVIESRPEKYDPAFAATAAERVRGVSAERAAELGAYLARFDLELTRAEYAPAYEVRIPIALLLEQVRWSSLVDWVDYAGTKKILFSTTSSDSMRLQRYWDSGFSGRYEKIAIVEHGRVNIDSAGTGWYNDLIAPNAINGRGTAATREPTLPTVCKDDSGFVILCLGDPHPDVHVTWVASLASNIKPGVPYWDPNAAHYGGAIGATVLSANARTEDDSDHRAAMDWAVARARVLNHSYGERKFYGYPRNPTFLDQIVDVQIRDLGVTQVKAVGNAPGETADGLSYNTIHVGGYNTNGDADWSNDTEFYFTTSKGTPVGTQYINPIRGWSWGLTPIKGDRELPEVVAPAQNILTAAAEVQPGGGNVSWYDSQPHSGTSFAAPLVSALAALMMDQRPELQFWPEAVKAAMMATAVNSIGTPLIDSSGNPVVVTPDFTTGKLGDNYTKDLKHGAGGVSAIGAKDILDNYNGFLRKGTLTPADFATSYRYPVQFAMPTGGDRMRIVLSWSSSLACKTCTDDKDVNDRQPTNRAVFPDFDLFLYDNNGNPVGWSASLDNNYEIVDFKTPAGATTVYAYIQRPYFDVSHFTPTHYGIAGYAYRLNSSGIPID